MIPVSAFSAPPSRENRSEDRAADYQQNSPDFICKTAHIFPISERCAPFSVTVSPLRRLSYELPVY